MKNETIVITLDLSGISEQVKNTKNAELARTNRERERLNNYRKWTTVAAHVAVSIAKEVFKDIIEITEISLDKMKMDATDYYINIEPPYLNVRITGLGDFRYRINSVTSIEQYESIIGGDINSVKSGDTTLLTATLRTIEFLTKKKIIN